MDHEASKSVNQQPNMEMAIKTEVETAATSTAHASDVDLNHTKQEPGLVQIVKSEPALLVKEEILEGSSQAAAMDHEASESVKQQPNMEIAIKIEVETAATSTAHASDVDLNDMKQQPGLVQTVKREPALLVKEDILEGSSQVSRKRSSQEKTEGGYDEAHVKTCLSQQMNLQQHRFNCDRSIHKPYLLSVNNKVHQRDSRQNSIMTSSIVPTDQNRDEKMKIKQKPNVCDKGYSLKAEKCRQSREVTKQMRVRTAEKHHKCDKCDAIFTQRAGLTVHMKVHTNEKPHRCETCDARFKRRYDLTIHMKVHTGEKPYRCDTCDTRCALKSNLISHMKVHTGEKPYRCETCDARWARKANLINHMRIHTSEKPYRCKTCDTRFKHSRSLSYHMKVHTGEKLYRCGTCDKRFKRRCDLTAHMRVHTGDKPYWCDTCDAKCARKTNLISHMRIHTTEKPYRCKTCDTRFKHSRSLSDHMKVHTGKKLNRCDLNAVVI